MVNALPKNTADSPDSAGIVLRSASTTPVSAPTGAASWWWVDSLDDVAFSTLRNNPTEAILTSDESVRTQIEQVLPKSVGDTWVAADPAIPFETILARYYPQRTESYRLGIIGYNLKFIRPILTSLVRNPGIEALIDEWRVFAAKPTAITDEVIAKADVVLCEWAGPNAVYASHNKRPDQKLVVRLHRFELDTDHWRQIDHEQVDQFVTVGDYYRNLVLQRTEWSAAKVAVISNQVDDLQLRRHKLPDSGFNIGMLGASSSRKRLDLAFDLIEKLHQHDARFRLHVKTALPQDEKWVWDNEKERDYFDREMARLETDPLRDLVTFDGFGTDVANWFRKIGFILSVSDDESFHLAPAEGMAAGSIPVVRNWPGADSVYAPAWVLSDTDDMASRILSMATDDLLRDAAVVRARQEAVDHFGMARVVDDWANLLGRWSSRTLQ
jgi:glycosyltransferase involved in cell wall biosynthesis